ncbi:MAG: type II toxin-antitoxin system RelE/ParE family toxin [Calditrichales bacterium]|nr:type II toxin-antitoxin system RelE/ParE family toxin [Calditrichales bacterium]
MFETDEFIKKLSKLTPQDKSFIQNKLSAYLYPQIKQSPWFGNNIKKLKGYTPETWRYRIGKFRLFYIIDDEKHTIYMLTIDHRKDAY